MPKWFPARPTIYRGIRMRSRLEADFARWLDSDDCEWMTRYREFGAQWDYEPQCFAGPAGQYLPDFRIDRAGENDDFFPIPGQIEYIEVKPLSASRDASSEWFRDPVEDFTKRMEIIWESEPQADLRLVFWTYQAKDPIISLYAQGWADHLWHADVPGLPPGMGPLLWSGRGQWADLSIARGYSIFTAAP